MLCQRILPLWVAIAILALLLAAPVSNRASCQPAKQAVRIRPAFTDKQQVGFMLLDADTKAHRITSDPHGSTHTVVLSIDDLPSTFGFETGAFLAKPQPLDQGRIGEQVTWKTAKIEVTQTVETVASKTGELDACVVTYMVVNRDDKPHSVGVRVLLDTFIEDNDGNPFRIPDSNNLITRQADFKGKDVPLVLLALQRPDLKNPGLVATLTLKLGGKLATPDRVSLTRFPDRDSAFGWEIPMRDIGTDAVAVIYWDAVEVKTGATRTVGFAYGGGEVAIKGK